MVRIADEYIGCACRVQQENPKRQKSAERYEKYKHGRTLREVLDTLHATGALANAVVAVASDNGGCPADGASNWPLRGTKFSSFEVHTYTRNDPVPLRLGLPL